MKQVDLSKDQQGGDMKAFQREEFKDAEIARLREALEFYTVGWVKKHSRINEYGLIEEVWKNTSIQLDHGNHARKALGLKMVGK